MRMLLLLSSSEGRNGQSLCLNSLKCRKGVDILEMMAKVRTAQRSRDGVEEGKQSGGIE